MRVRPLAMHAALIVGLALCQSLSAVHAEVGPTREEFKAMVLPIYQSLQTDAEFLRFNEQLAGHFDDTELVDRYLRFLPISPLEVAELKMETNRYEHIVPSFVEVWHHRWIELHESTAIEHYGAAYVEQKLADHRAWSHAEESRQAVVAKGTFGGTEVSENRNAAWNYAIPPEEYQGEIQIGVNPNNPEELVAAANTWDNMNGSCGDYGLQAVFFSADGGQTWGYSCPPDADEFEDEVEMDTAMDCGALGGVTMGSDPAVVWNDGGEVFLEYMLICMKSQAETYYSVVVAKSSDGGATWHPQGVVKNSWHLANLIEDKNFYAIDRHQGSPYYNRHYTCWDRKNKAKSAWSSDDGQTWHEVNLPVPPVWVFSGPDAFGSLQDLGCELAVNDDGRVHIVWSTMLCGPEGCTKQAIFHTKSTDGGVTWSAADLVHKLSLVSHSGNNCPKAQDSRCISPFGSIDVDTSGGKCDGTLYTTFTDHTPQTSVQHSDIFVRASTDGGTTWGPAVRVNDDVNTTNRLQFSSFLVTDPVSGDVVVAWYDGRNDIYNQGDIDVYAARSTDCGKSFKSNVKVTKPSKEFNDSSISHSNQSMAKSAAANPNQFGEYLGLDVYDRTAYVAWSDTRHFSSTPSETQQENLGFAAIEFSTPWFELITWALEPWGDFNEWSGCPGQLAIPEDAEELEFELRLSSDAPGVRFTMVDAPRSGHAELVDGTLTYSGPADVTDTVRLEATDGRTTAQVVVDIEAGGDVRSKRGEATGTCRVVTSRD